MRFVPEEAMNCIHECRSPECYDILYGKDPLEPGQIDTDRAKEFDTCNRSELMNARKQEKLDRRTVKS